MRDYKFNHSGLDFDKPKRPIGRWLLRITILGIVIFGAYQIYLSIDWDDTGTTLRTNEDPNVIPLEIPPNNSSDSPPKEGKVGTTRQHRQETPIGSEIPAHASIQIPAVKPSGWIDHIVTPGETLSQIFHHHDLSPGLLQQILTSSGNKRQLANIHPGDELRMHLDDSFKLTEFQLRLDSLRSLSFKVTDSGIQLRKLEKPTKTHFKTTTGVIRHSLFSAAGKANIPPAVTKQIASIFGWEIDFALEIRAGDRFSVTYEEKVTEDDATVGSGAVLAADFTNRGKTFQAVRFKDRHGKTEYYDARGVPMKKTFFRTPVQFTRISSGFTKRRWHPVKGGWRAHKGVDYAAPSGTPVIATGDGVIEIKGWKKGYGRVVQLKHGRRYRTVYGHLSRFASGIKHGQQIEQGDVIGYVGQSGLATGPHLHYEFHVDGSHKNPLAVNAPMADPLYGQDKKLFDKAAKPLLARFDAVKHNLLADVR